MKSIIIFPEYDVDSGISKTKIKILIYRELIDSYRKCVGEYIYIKIKEETSTDNFLFYPYKQ